MKVYVLTEGSYSDFRLHSVWSTRENAEAWLKRARADQNNDMNDAVEIYDVDPVEPSDERPVFRVLMRKDGQLATRSMGGEPLRGVEEIGKAGLPETFRIHYVLGDEPIDASVPPHKRPRASARAFVLRAESHEQSVKVVNERRTAMILAGTWDSDEAK